MRRRALVAVALAACTVDTQVPAGALLRCGAEDRCGGGQICQRGYCRPEPGPGTLALGGVRISPSDPQPGEMLSAYPVGLRPRAGATPVLTVEWLVDDAPEGSGPTLAAPSAGRVAARIRAVDDTGALVEKTSCPIAIGAPREPWTSDRPPRARSPDVAPMDEPPPRALVQAEERRLLLLVPYPSGGAALWAFELEGPSEAPPGFEAGARGGHRWSQRLALDGALLGASFLRRDGAAVEAHAPEVSLRIDPARGCESVTGPGDPPFLPAASVEDPDRAESLSLALKQDGVTLVFGPWSADASARAWEPVNGAAWRERGAIALERTPTGRTLWWIGGDGSAPGEAALLDPDAWGSAWRRPAPSGDLPPGDWRDPAAAASIDREGVWVWGGSTPAAGFGRSLYFAALADDSTVTWSRVEVAGDRPEPGPAAFALDPGAPGDPRLLLVVLPPNGGPRLYLLDESDPPRFVELDPHPAPRFRHPAAADDRHFVLFGGVEGRSADGERIAAAETWVHDGDRWHRLAGANDPPAREGGVMAELGGGRFLLNGGRSTADENLGDTHLLDLSAGLDRARWTELAVADAPPPRAYHRAADLPAQPGERGRVYVQGGLIDGLAVALGGVIVVDPGSARFEPWPDDGPPARAGASIAYAPGADRLSVFGGLTHGPEAPDGERLLGDLWLAGATGPFAERRVEPAPEPRMDHTLIALGPEADLLWGGAGFDGAATLLCHDGESSRAVPLAVPDPLHRACGANTARAFRRGDAVHFLGGDNDADCDALWTLRGVADLLQACAIENRSPARSDRSRPPPRAE